MRLTLVSARAVPAAAAPAATAPAAFVARLLELLPLLGRQHLTHALVRLSANLREARLGLFAQRLKLRARVAEYLLDLRSLFGIQLEVVDHTLDAILATVVRVVVNPRAVRARRERARREAEYEDE